MTGNSTFENLMPLDESPRVTEKEFIVIIFLVCTQFIYDPCVRRRGSNSKPLGHNKTLK